MKANYKTVVKRAVRASAQAFIVLVLLGIGAMCVHSIYELVQIFRTNPLAAALGIFIASTITIIAIFFAKLVRWAFSE